jgi:hypothetical protein
MISVERQQPSMIFKQAHLIRQTRLRN